jgi:hypothetical protein
MAALCGPSCGWCGRCTAPWEHEGECPWCGDRSCACRCLLAEQEREFDTDRDFGDETDA